LLLDQQRLLTLIPSRRIVGNPAGMFCAIAQYRRNELADAVVAHATTSAPIAGNVATTGNWLLRM
jgi:hypothetical protein